MPDSHALSRLELLIGEDAVQRLAAASFLVCGLGGVGSWAAEALVRNGVGSVTIVDFDVVQTTNVNRQAQALSSTIGQPKAQAMAARLRDIAPGCQVVPLNQHLDREAIEALLSQRRWDGVLDAIDERQPKLELLASCVQKGIPVVTSMGAANKVDPAEIRCVDISETTGCPFAKIIRKALRQQGITKGIKCVFSPELPVLIPEAQHDDGQRRPLGSMVTVTATFGFRCAHELMKPLMNLDSLTHRGD